MDEQTVVNTIEGVREVHVQDMNFLTCMHVVGKVIHKLVEQGQRPAFPEPREK